MLAITNYMQKVGVKRNYMQKLHSNDTQFFLSALIQVLIIEISTHVIKPLKKRENYSF